MAIRRGASTGRYNLLVVGALRRASQRKFLGPRAVRWYAPSSVPFCVDRSVKQTNLEPPTAREDLNGTIRKTNEFAPDMNASIFRRSPRSTARF